MNVPTTPGGTPVMRPFQPSRRASDMALNLVVFDPAITEAFSKCVGQRRHEPGGCHLLGPPPFSHAVRRVPRYLRTMFAEHLLRFHQDVLEYEKSARDIEARRDRAGEIFAAYLSPKGGHDVELDVPSLFEIKKNLALDKKGRPQQKEPGTLTYAFHTAMVKIFMRLKFECVNRTLLLLRCYYCWY